MPSIIHYYYVPVDYTCILDFLDCLAFESVQSELPLIGCNTHDNTRHTTHSLRMNFRADFVQTKEGTRVGNGYFFNVSSASFHGRTARSASALSPCPRIIYSLESRWRGGCSLASCSSTRVCVWYDIGAAIHPTEDGLCLSTAATLTQQQVANAPLCESRPLRWRFVPGQPSERVKKKALL